MCITIKNCFYKNLTFEKLYAAHIRARKHKSNKLELIRFELDLENNLINLLNSIKNNTYKLGEYTEFYVYEPKKRLIKALPYKDRIVHQWYVEEFIKPYIVPRFISHSFACINGRGTHNAAMTAQTLQNKAYHNFGENFWIIKCDIKHFFNNIDTNVLSKIMKRYISDKKLMEFTNLLIGYSANKNIVGIPIGNYTSQYFANIYLNELDYYIKHDLHIKYYIRYMDGATRC